VTLPPLVKAYDYSSPTTAANGGEIVPNRLIRDSGRPLLKALLQAPLCYSHAGVRHGTLKSLSAWCPDKRTDIKLHFAKTGTSVGLDVNATVDTWIAGGLQFNNGAAYSYVVVVGTGSPSQSWANSLHAAQVGVPLLETLLTDLKEHARKHPPAAPAQIKPVASAGVPSRNSSPSWREKLFQSN
jgi:penicillin-binding protein 1A